MTARRAAAIAIASVGVAAVALILYITLPRWRGRAAANRGATSAPAAPAAPGRKIKARLFYVSEDGTRLTGVERDVAYGDGIEQAREVINAQIAPVSQPLVSAVPPGTALRTLFITDRGAAYVDLSHDVVSAQTGGTLNEMLTVYTIVDALTANLPAVHAVQILVDGKEVQTLSGHVDLRQPLIQNLSLVQ